jgi:hypothetical protein
MAESGRAGSYHLSTPEGWWVTHLPSYRFLTDHPPPRPHALLYCLRLESRSWKALAIWLGGASAMAIGIGFGEWLSVALGSAVLLIWLWFFLRFALPLRGQPALTGVVETLAPHPFGSGYSTARAKLSDGRVLPVVLFTSESKVLERHGQIEVLFLYAPQSQYSIVLGIREIPSRPNADGPDDSTVSPTAPA